MPSLASPHDKYDSCVTIPPDGHTTICLRWLPRWARVAEGNARA